MPLGRVFNAAENQILISPVTAAYKGKAIRQGLAKAEFDLSTQEERFGLEKKRVELAENELELRQDKANLLREDFEHRVGKDKAKTYATEGYAAMWSAEQKMQTDPEGGLALAYENLQKYVATLPEEDKAGLARFLEDGVITIDEFNQIKAGFVGALGEYDLLEEDGVTVKDHQNYRMPDGTIIMARPDSAKSNAIEEAGGIRISNAPSDKTLGIGETGEDIKASDESFILRMVGQHFGGIFNEETNQVNFLDPSKQRRASEITALAASKFARGVEKTRSGAVKAAMKAFGEKWEEPKGVSTKEPSYEVGDIIEKGGKKYEVVGFFEDGEEEVREIG